MEEEIEKCWDSLPPDIKEVLLKEGELQKAPVKDIKEKVYFCKEKLPIYSVSNLFNFSNTSLTFGNSSYQRIEFWHRVIRFEDYKLFYKKVPCSKEVIVGGEKFMI